MSNEQSEATRYFCASGYLNQAFRSQVIAEEEERHKAYAESYGVDMPRVVFHCRGARKRKRMRDGLLMGILLLGALLFLISTSDFTDSDAVLANLLKWVVPSASLAWVVVFLDDWQIRNQIIAKSFLKSTFRSVEQTEPAAGNAKNMVHAVIYGGYSPFVGSGVEVGAWSFAINVEKGKQDINSVSEPESFTIGEVYQHIEHHLDSLSIPGLVVADRVFVNGREIRDDRRFLDTPYSRPRTFVDAALLQSVIDAPLEHVRHYKCVEVPAWKGELVLSIFLRFARTGPSLFAEASYFLLTPLKDEHRAIDAMTVRPTWRYITQRAVVTLITAPFALAFSPLMLWLSFQESASRRKHARETKRLIHDNAAFNYGAVTSIRESESSGAYRQYFQKLDKEMYLKVVEKEVLDCLIEFLDDKNIDTSEFKERQAMILNNGVIVSGGTVATENLTVGQQAKTVAINMTKRVKAKAAATR